MSLPKQIVWLRRRNHLDPTTRWNPHLADTYTVEVLTTDRMRKIIHIDQQGSRRFYIQSQISSGWAGTPRSINRQRTIIEALFRAIRSLDPTMDEKSTTLSRYHSNCRWRAFEEPSRQHNLRVFCREAMGVTAS